MTTCSMELQKGKAAEHLVVADLILQGHNAFLTDQGVAYDVVVDTGGIMYRVQVKASSTQYRRPDRTDIPRYRFSLRRAKKSARLTDSSEFDILAVVALDTKQIGYLPVSVLTRPDGKLISGLEISSKEHDRNGRIYTTGKQREITYGRFIEDHAVFGGRV
jgi:hypothetical protein